MASELKPCPLCSADPSSKFTDIKAAIWCEPCGLHMEYSTAMVSLRIAEEYQRSILTKRWNTRPPPVAPVSPDATGKCGELVTVETQFRMTDRTDRPWGNGPIPEYLNGYAVSRELVTRSQAVELLAAERAENTRLQSENDAQADQISELQMTPWPEWATKVLAVIRKRSGYDGYGDAIEGVDLPAELDECIAAIEADNAALTARVKELEEHCELLCDPTIIRLEKENSDLEAKLAAAGKIGQEVLSLIAGDAGIPDHIRDKARAVLGGKPS
ncbi:Lar family restriction alleviation protein [Brucella anthropi]|uniref:Lar family restriction alleviation protein n=1 Tax=Brucella anthropi TaxID=529 RepID=UPI00124EBBA1|nr:Lar family restriction alleviation protein [Brucella anthropi]KAB2751765.1 hypothetical protein F9L05_01110 [Brucella anthropi]